MVVGPHSFNHIRLWSSCCAARRTATSHRRECCDRGGWPRRRRESRRLRWFIAAARHLRRSQRVIPALEMGATVDQREGARMRASARVGEAAELASDAHQ